MKEIKRISSRENRRLVNARKVRDGNVPGQVFVEGRRLVAEALRSDITIDECFVARGFPDHELLVAVSKKTNDVAEIPGNLFDSIADTDHPQGIILIARRPETSSDLIEAGLTSAEIPIVVLLKEINNPSNLGAIIRTAEAAGVAGVIVSKNSADVFSPKALRASMGSSFRLPVWDETDFDRVLKWAKERNLTPTAADMSAKQMYTQLNWKTPRLVILGSEAHGLSAPEMERIDELIHIPMDSAVESLNVAVSAGIILFEARRQNTQTN